MDPDTRSEIDGRLSITQAQTPTGITFQVINIYQVTAANPAGQTELWTTTENWVNKQKGYNAGGPKLRTPPASGQSSEVWGSLTLISSKNYIVNRG